MVDSITKSKIDEINSAIQKFKSLDQDLIPDLFSVALSVSDESFWVASTEPAEINIPGDYAYFLNTIGPLTIYRRGYNALVFGPPVALGELDLSFEDCAENPDLRFQYLPELILTEDFDPSTSVADWADSAGVADWLICGVGGDVFTGLWGYSPSTSHPQLQIFHGIDVQTEEWLSEPLAFIQLLAESFFDLPVIKLLLMPEFTEEFFSFPDAALEILEKNGDALQFLSKDCWDQKLVVAALQSDPWSARFLRGTSYCSKVFMKKAMKTLRDTGYVFPYGEFERNLIVGLLESIPDIGEEKVLNILHRADYESSPADLPPMRV